MYNQYPSFFALRKYFSAISISCFSLLAPSAHSTVNYIFSDLSATEGMYSYAQAINYSGKIAGWSPSITDQSGHSNATYWQNGDQAVLGTLGGTFSQAFGVNSAGQVVGISHTNGNKTVRATLWNDSVAIDLGTLGGMSSYAFAINDGGRVVGMSESVENVGQRATLWDGGTAIDLGTLGGSYGKALAINNSGLVAGISYRSGDETYRATLWHDGYITDLGTLGGSSSEAHAINDSGQVVGYSWLAGDTVLHATLWSSGKATDLGTLGGTSNATAINRHGQIVGYSDNTGGVGNTRAVMWDGGVLIDLNSFLDATTVAAGWTLYDARGINDLGWISGQARNYMTGEQHAYVLSVVPEPAAYLLALVGLCVIGFRNKFAGQ